jgi:hypothetical protein
VLGRDKRCEKKVSGTSPARLAGRLPCTLGSGKYSPLLYRCFREGGHEKTVDTELKTSLNLNPTAH